MVTEAFNIKYGEETAYLNIDRTYQYGGIMLLADLLNDVCLGGIDGYTYFAEFNLDKWLKQLNLTEGVVTIEVAKKCDGMINYGIYKDRFDDVLSIIIKDGKVSTVKNDKDEVIYTKGDDYIDDWEVGWFGKVFDYYTRNISSEIEDIVEDYESIWGVYYPN